MGELLGPDLGRGPSVSDLCFGPTKLRLHPVFLFTPTWKSIKEDILKRLSKQIAHGRLFLLIFYSVIGNQQPFGWLINKISYFIFRKVKKYFFPSVYLCLEIFKTKEE